jgi:hypothetical protein
MTSKTVRVQIHSSDGMCCIPVPFDPKAVFGKVRAPVKVTLNGYTFRSTIGSMKGVTAIPLRRSHREAAGLNGDETLRVTIALDTEAREVVEPDDLRTALEGQPALLERWKALSYTHQREHADAIEGAKKPETRARRIDNTLKALATLEK